MLPWQLSIYKTVLLTVAIMLCITPQNTTFGDNTADCPKPITCTPTEKVQGISGSLIIH